MTTIPKKFTYILAPSCEILPADAALSLGSIVTEPLEPEETVLNEHDRIPVENIKLRTASNWRTTIGKLREHKLTIWASFLQFLVGLGFNINGSYKNDTEDIYKFDKLETKSFSPDKAFIDASLAAEEVAAFLEAGKWEKPVYLVTGVKIAYGAHITSKRVKGWGAGADLSFDGTSLGAPVSGGPKSENNVNSTREVEIGNIPELVFAYRLTKIIASRDGSFKSEPFVEGALFGVVEDQNVGETYSWAAEDFTVALDEQQIYQVFNEDVIDDDDNEEVYVVVKPQIKLE